MALPSAPSWLRKIAFGLALLAFPAISTAVSSGNLLYQFQVVARTGDAGVSAIPGAALGAIGQNASINSFGTVGFQSALSTGGNGLFIAKIGASAAFNINPGFSNTPTRTFSTSVMINNANVITARDQVPGSPPDNLVRMWNAGTSDAFTTIARGGNAQPFDAVFAFPSGNDNGDVVFSALDATLGSVLATPVTQGNSSNFNKVALTTPLLPKIAANGKVVVRAGGTAAAPIRLYENNLQSFVTIAGGGTAPFTTVGRAPGVNGDGSIVAFTGNRGKGDGVFASVDIGGSRQIIKIAGEGTVGVTPLATSSGSPVVPPDLGYDDSLQPVGFASIAVDSRVGIAHQALGVPGVEGDSFVVTFIATAPTVTQTDYYLSGIEFTGNRGIWTVRVDVFNKNGELRFRLGPPMPVVQIGDSIQSAGPNPQTFIVDVLPDLYDPIANVASDDGVTPRTSVAGEHYIVFWASSGTTQRLIRAKQTDTCLTRVQRIPQGTNPAWKAEKYAFSTSETIAAKGCAMTSFTMQTNSLFFENGVNRGFDPLGMNAFMKTAHAFAVEPSPPAAKPTLIVSAKAIAALNPLPEVTAKGLFIVYSEVPGKTWQYNSPTRKGILDASLLPGALATIDAAICFERASIRIGVDVSCSKVGGGATDVDGNAKCVARTEYVQDPVQGRIAVESKDPLTGLVVPKSIVPGHYILVAGKVGNNYFLADPGHKSRKLLGAAPYNNVFELRGTVTDPTDLSFLAAVTTANAELSLRDAQNRATGIDSGNGAIRNDIPSSSYSHEMYDSLDTLQPADEQFSTLYVRNPLPGSYTLTVLETASGPYQIQIDIARPDGGLQLPVFISGVATPGITKVYAIDVATGVGGTPSATLQSVKVPDLTGFTQANGSAFLNAAGLAVGTVSSQPSNTVPAGQIISQALQAGTLVAPGTAVAFVVSTGSGVNALVPDVVGQTEAAATTTITNAGFVVGTVTQQSSASVPSGTVISQTPSAGASAVPGSVVNLVVSIGVSSKLSTAVVISAHTPSPSAVGAAIVVTASVTVTPPGAGTPTGSISVSDGSASCLVTLPAATCNLTLTSTGVKTLRAIYSGDANFAGSTSAGVSHTVSAAPATLDIDASITASKYDAPTDGLLAIRYLFGLTGLSLTVDALGSTATRTDPVAIKDYLDSVRPALDIDGDGKADALTDGLLIIRYLLGLRGNALIVGAIAPLAPRSTAEAIEAHFMTLTP